MAAILYPSTLPCPQTSTVTPAERRALSDPQRPRDARNISRDRLEYERITFPPMNPDQCETLMGFWRDTLKRGGAWFVADWPLPRGMNVQAVRKFREQPKWQFVAGGFWRISALCEVRGRGMLIDDQYIAPALIRLWGPAPEIAPGSAYDILASSPEGAVAIQDAWWNKDGTPVTVTFLGLDETGVIAHTHVVWEAGDYYIDIGSSLTRDSRACPAGTVEFEDGCSWT